MKYELVVIISFSIGSIVGFFFKEIVRPFWDHKLARSRNVEAAQVSNFIGKYNAFHESFVPAMQSLMKSGSSLKQIITADFLKHETAMLTFVDVLKTDRERYNRFRKIWTEYEKAHKQCNQYEEFDNIEYSLSLINRPDFAERMSSKDREMWLKFKEKVFTSDSTNKKYIHSLLSNLLEIANKY